MSKKILIIFGSPRANGNTSTAVKWFSEGAKSCGATVEIVNANLLQHKTPGCTACMSCQKSDKRECVIKDEISAVIKRIPEFDALIIATPIYAFGPSAQIKIVLDRMFALEKIDEKISGQMANKTTKKTLGLIATAGGGLELGLNLLDTTFKMLSEFSNEHYASLLVPFCGFEHDAIMRKSDIRDQAILLGKKIATN